MRASSSQRPNKSRPPTTQFRSSPYDPYLLSSAVYNTGSSSSIATTPPVPSLPRLDHRRGESDTEHIPAFVPKTTRGYDSEVARSSQYQIWNPPTSSVKGRPSSRSRGVYESEAASVSRTPADAPDRRSRIARATPRMRESSPIVDESSSQPRGASPLPAKAVETSVPASTPPTYVSSSRRPLDPPRRKIADDQPKAVPEQLVVSTVPPLPRLEKSSSSSSTELLSDTSRKASETPPSSARPSPSDPVSFRKASVDGLFDEARPTSILQSVIEVPDSPKPDRAPKERSYPGSPPPAPLMAPLTLVPDKTSVFNPVDGSEIPTVVPQEKTILLITETENQGKKPSKKEKTRKVLAITQGPVNDQDSQAVDAPVIQKPKWPVWLRLPQSPFSQADSFSTPDMGASSLPNDDDVVVYSVASPLPPSPPHRSLNQPTKVSPRVRRRSNSGARQPRRKNSGDDRDSVSQTSLPPPSPVLHVSQQATKPAPAMEDKPGPVVEAKSVVPMEVKTATSVVEVKPVIPVAEVKPTIPMVEETQAAPVVEEKPSVTIEERPVRAASEKPARANEGKAARVAGDVGKSASKSKIRTLESPAIPRETESPPAVKEIEVAPVSRKPETHFTARTSPLSTRRVSIKAEEMATSYFDLRSPSMEKLPLHEPMTPAPAVPALPSFIAPEPNPTPSAAAKLADIISVAPVPSEPSSTPLTDDHKMITLTVDSHSIPPSPAKEPAEHRHSSSTSTAPSAHRPFLPDYTRHIRKRSSSTTSQIKVVDDRAATPTDVSPEDLNSTTNPRSVASTVSTAPTLRPEDEVLPVVASGLLTMDVPSRRLSLHPNRSSRTPVALSQHDSVPLPDGKCTSPPVEDPKETLDHGRRITTMQSSVVPIAEITPPNDSANMPKTLELTQELEPPQRVASRPLSRAPVSSRPRRSDRSNRVTEPESNEEVKLTPTDDAPSRPRAIVLDAPVEHYGNPIGISASHELVQAGDDIPSSLPHVVDAPLNQPSKQGRFPIVDIDAMTPRLDAMHSIRDRHVRRPSLQVDKLPEVRSISPLELEGVKSAEPQREESQQASAQIANAASSYSVQRQEPTVARTSPVDSHVASSQPERSHKQSSTSKHPTAIPPPALRRTSPDKLPTLAKSNNPIWLDPRLTHSRNTSEALDSGTIQLSSPLVTPAPLAQAEKTVDAAPMRPSFTHSRSAPAVVDSAPPQNEFDISSPVIPLQPPLQPALEETDWPARARSRSNARDTSNAVPSNAATAVPSLRSSPTPSSSRQANGSPVPGARSSALPLSRRLHAQAVVEPAPVEAQPEDPPPRKTEVRPTVSAPPVPDPMQKPLRSALRNTSSHQSNRRHQIVNEPAFDSTPPPPPVPKLPPVIAPPPKAPSPIPPPLHHRPSTPASSSSDIGDPVAPTKKKGGLFRQFWKGESKPPTIQPSQEKNDSSSILSRTTSKQKDPVPILSSSTQRSSPAPAASGQSVKYSTPIPRAGGSNSSMPSAAAPSSILRKPPPKDKGLLSSVNNLFGAKRQHRTVSSASLEAVLGASNNNPTSPAPSQMDIPPLPTRDMYDAVARWQKDEERTQLAAVREGKRRPRPGVTWNDLNSEPGSPTR